MQESSKQQEDSYQSLKLPQINPKRNGPSIAFVPPDSYKDQGLEEEQKQIDYMKYRSNSEKNMGIDDEKSAKHNSVDPTSAQRKGEKIQDAVMGGAPGKVGKIDDDNIDQNVLNEINQQALERAEALSLKQRIYEDVVDNSKFLWITYINVRFYWLVILIVSLIQFICIGMTIWKGLLSVNFPTIRDMYITSDYRTLRDDSQQTVLNYLNAFISKAQATQTPTQTTNTTNQTVTQTKPRSQAYTGNSMQVLYKCRSCKTLYTAEYIKEIYRFEKQYIESNPLWKVLCYYGDSTKYPTTGNIGCPGESYGNRTHFLRPYIEANNLTDEIAQSLFEKNYGTQRGYYDNRASFSKSFSTSNLYTNIEASNYVIGGPFYYNGVLYNEKTGSGIIHQFTNELYDQAANFDSDLLEVYAGNYFMQTEMVSDAINHDLLLVLGCCAFIWFYVSIHVKSLFLSTISMLNILFTIPVAMVFYRLIVQIPYFCVLHILVLLLLLGIGADNLFLYNDTWKGTKLIKAIKDDHHKRAAYSFRKASKAIISTSITNFLAFVGTTTSQIMPISAFGIFATISIGMVYMFIIFVIPSYYIFYEKHIEKKCTCLDRLFAHIGRNVQKLFNRIRRKQENNKVVQNQPQVIVLDNEDHSKPHEQPENISDLQKDQNNDKDQEKKAEDEKSQEEKIGQLSNQDGQNISVEIVRQEDIKISQYGNSPLEQKKEPSPESSSEKSPLEKAEQEINYEDFIKTQGIVDRFFDKVFSKLIFKTRIGIVVISVVWLALIIWRGSQIDQFQGQESFFYKEHPLQRQLDINLYEMYNSNNNILVRFNFGAQPQLETSKVSKWNTLYLGDIQWDRTFNPAPKVNQMALYNFCQQLKTFSWTSNDTFGRRPQIQCYIEDFKNWVESIGQVFPVEESRFHSVAFNFTANTKQGNNHIFSRNVYLKNGQVAYLQVQVISRGDTLQTAQEKENIFQQWESFAINFNQNSPIGVKNIWQSSDSWPYMILQLAFYQNAINGLVYSLLFAFLVLILSTHNIIVSMYAVFIIGSVSASVIGIMNLMNWQLGLTESLGIDLFVGFSVDYIVHVAHGYIEPMYDQRKQRVDNTYQNIGLAVFSGAITTTISGIFITVSNLYVLRKFGILIELTIVFSILFGLVSFPAFLYLIGPQYKQGDLKHYLWNPLINKCKKKQVKPSKPQQQKIKTDQSQKSQERKDFEKNHGPDEEDQLYDEDNQDDDDYEEGDEDDDDDYNDDEGEIQSDREHNNSNTNRVTAFVPFATSHNSEQKQKEQQDL